MYLELKPTDEAPMNRHAGNGHVVTSYYVVVGFFQ